MVNIWDVGNSETILPGLTTRTQTKDKGKENAPSGIKERRKRKGQKIKKKGSRNGWHVF
jgi:hypothetical protein